MRCEVGVEKVAGVVGGGPVEFTGVPEVGSQVEGFGEGFEGLRLGGWGGGPCHSCCQLAGLYICSLVCKRGGRTHGAVAGMADWSSDKGGHPAVLYQCTDSML